MKFSGKVGNWPLNKRLNFGGDPDHRLDTGIVFRFVTIGRYGRPYMVITGHKSASPQTESPHGCTGSTCFAEVCTVPVLLVNFLRLLFHIPKNPSCLLPLTRKQGNSARNNARCTQARKTTHGLDRQHQDVDRTLCGRVNQNDRGQR